jgi:hypothetical protein
MNARFVFLIPLIVTAACTDLQPLEARLDDLQNQVTALHAEIAKSANNAAAANKATNVSASAAAADAKQALSVGEANAKGIDAVNAKIDQMFRKRPTEQ